MGSSSGWLVRLEADAPDVVACWRVLDDSLDGALAKTADDVIHLQDQHLKDAVAAGDESHAPALKDMKSRWRRPVSGLKWYNQAKKDFAALPEG